MSLLAQLRRRLRPGTSAPDEGPYLIEEFATAPDEIQRILDEASRGWRDSGWTREQRDAEIRSQLARPEIQAQLREADEWYAGLAMRHPELPRLR